MAREQVAGEVSMERPNYLERPALAQERPGLAAAVNEFRRAFILSALSRNEGNQRATARELSIGYSTLKAFLKRLRAR